MVTDTLTTRTETRQDHRVIGCNHEDRCCRPRVLVICPVKLLDCDEREQLVQLTRFLQEEDWPFTMYSWESASRPTEIGAKDRCYVRRSSTSRWGHLRELTRLVAQHDIIHVCLFSRMSLAIHAVVPILAGRFFGRKVVLDYRGSQAAVQLESMNRIGLRLLGLCDRVLVSSGRLGDAMARSGLRAAPIAGVADADRVKSRQINSVQPRILTVRSLDRFSNLGTLVRAFKLVKEKYPRAELVIVGDGPDRARLAQLLADERVDTIRVVAEGRFQEIAHHYAWADVFVNPASVDEVPQSMLKALVTGLPVVTVVSRGIEEIISDGFNGLLVRRADFAQLAGRIIELVEKPTLVHGLSERSKQTAERFAWSHARGKWLDFYGKL